MLFQLFITLVCPDALSSCFRGRIGSLAFIGFFILILTFTEVSLSFSGASFIEMQSSHFFP